MASLQAALKRAIESGYRLEDRELAAEPLPDRDRRNQLLFYEAAEGGAGALNQLAADRFAFAKVGRRALEICHFSADGEDLLRAPKASEACEAACYDCLLSYGNQREHELLDRKAIRVWLLDLAEAEASLGAAAPREERLASLMRRCDSDLERDWLTALADAGLRLPDAAQKLIAICQTRPDFVYESRGIQAAIYIDGQRHDYPQQQQRDRAQSDCLMNAGYDVIRFGYSDDWEQIFRDCDYVFGGGA